MILTNSTSQLWLIGGTRESSRLAREIVSLGIPCLVTVTTDAARSLYPKADNLQVAVLSLQKQTIDSFCQENSIRAILDASHPYAVFISKLAIAVASQRQIPYLRFEREAVETQEASEVNVIYLDSFETLLASDYLNQQRALLTVGYKVLPLFCQWQNRSTLFARILPSLHSLEVAFAAGFSSERIIALRPPFSIPFEIALWHHWNISLVVTKASGVPGGEDIKRTVAIELGIPLIVISRPAIEYPQQTSQLSVAIEFCQRNIRES